MMVTMMVMVMTVMMARLMTNEGMWWHKSSGRVNSDTHDINCLSKIDRNDDGDGDHRHGHDDGVDYGDDYCSDDDDDDDDDESIHQGANSIPHASTSCL